MFNQTISIHHIIDETSKEIYEFEKTSSNTWEYVGIYFSHRNDKNDVWGDQWDKFYESHRIFNYDEIAKSLGYNDHTEIFDECDYHSYECDKLREIDTKYNPTCQKTKNFKTYYYGIYWGYGSKERLNYPPKITEEQVKQEILKQTSKIKVKF